MTMELHTTADTCLSAERPEKGLFQTFWQSIAQLFKERADRQTLSTLSKLDDRALRDIGLNRGDVMWANTLPLTRNANEALNEIRASNIATARRRVVDGVSRKRH